MSMIKRVKKVKEMMKIRRGPKRIKKILGRRCRRRGRRRRVGSWSLTRTM
jgi:hypothetical protein